MMLRADPAIDATGPDRVQVIRAWLASMNEVDVSGEWVTAFEHPVPAPEPEHPQPPILIRRKTAADYTQPPCCVTVKGRECRFVGDRYLVDGKWYCGTHHPSRCVTVWM